MGSGRITEGIELLKIAWMKRRGGFQCRIGRLLKRMIGTQVTTRQSPLTKERLAYTSDQRHPQRTAGLIVPVIRPRGRTECENHHGNADLGRLPAPLRNVAHDHNGLDSSVRIVPRPQCITYGQHDHKYCFPHMKKPRCRGLHDGNQSGDDAFGNQLTRNFTIFLRGLMVRRIDGDRRSRHGGIGQLDGP